MNNHHQIEVNQLNDSAKKSLKMRVIYALIMAVIGLPCLILGGWFYLVLVFLIVGFSTYEIIRATNKKFSAFIWVITYIVIYALMFWIALKTNLKAYNDNPGTYVFDVNTSFTSIAISPITIGAMIFFFFLIVILKEDFVLMDACYLIAMTLVLTIGYQSVLALRYIPFKNFAGIVDTSTATFKYAQSMFLMIYLLIGIMFNDIGAYFVGVFFGKHKINPRISPKKTYEGFFGGIVISTLFSLAFGLIVSSCGLPILPEFDLAHWYWILLGSLILPLLGNVGDFTFSAIKRHFNTKDYSHILGPHGGFLDRFDSTIFGAAGLCILVLLVTNGWNFLI